MKLVCTSLVILTALACSSDDSDKKSTQQETNEDTQVTDDNEQTNDNNDSTNNNNTGTLGGEDSFVIQDETKREIQPVIASSDEVAGKPLQTVEEFDKELVSFEPYENIYTVGNDKYIYGIKEHKIQKAPDVSGQQFYCGDRDDLSKTNFIAPGTILYSKSEDSITLYICYGAYRNSAQKLGTIKEGDILFQPIVGYAKKESEISFKNRSVIYRKSENHIEWVYQGQNSQNSTMKKRPEDFADGSPFVGPFSFRYSNSSSNDVFSITDFNFENMTPTFKFRDSKLVNRIVPYIKISYSDFAQ